MKILAIASCRVSTSEQRENNSLTRQEESVRKAAAELGAEIPSDGWWSGDVSSKAGKNFSRKDLKEMLDYCKTHKTVKYLIVDEPDRFMRSIDEAFYYEVRFREEAGVQVWYASDPQLNTGDLTAKMLRFSKYFSAEGGNVERQTKSITGHQKAIREGRYTFPVKPGYKKGTEPGIHLPHPITFKPLQEAFRSIANRSSSPLDALKKLNTSEFSDHHAAWRMDKFSQFAIDPYYMGAVVMAKQVNVRNESGQHEPMLTKAEHQQLVEIFTAKTKPRGAKKQYNPDFPLNKILVCEDCGNDTKFTGSKKNNGYSRLKTSYYFKYHCRGCGKAYHRDTVHTELTNKLNKVQYTGAQKQELINALETVWRGQQADKLKYAQQLETRLTKLKETKSGLLNELAGADDSLKVDIKEQIADIRTIMGELETKIEAAKSIDQDLVEFITFALGYTEVLAEDWWQLDHEQQVQCQQLIFPGGISFNSQKKVGTTKLSPIFGFKTNKNAPDLSSGALMVELIEKSWHSIEQEISRWRSLLVVPYQSTAIGSTTNKYQPQMVK